MQEVAGGRDVSSGPGPDQDQEGSGLRPSGPPPSPSCEELFCGGRTPLPLAGALAGALAGPRGPPGDVVKRGYLGKQERGHRRYFVLRAGSHTGPGRLEWYKNQDKFTTAHKSASRAALFSCNKQGVIYLRCCLGVSRICGSRKGHTVALYAKDQTVVLVMDDRQEQEDWYTAMKRLMEEEQRDEEHPDEEDYGYCTLPPAAFFKEVWPVTVKSRGASGSKSLAGENRLCLTATSLIVVRVGAGGDLPSVTIPLLSVRRFGHLDGSFFLELGRSAPNGPGEIWMEARDQGDHPALAQHIHEAVREAVRALRVLPDFSRSPSYKSPSRVLLVSKRRRPKLGPRNPDNRPRPDEPGPESCPSDPSPPRVQAVSYMEMNQSWESAEEEEEEEDEEEDEEEEGRLGYMVMSPQEDYVTMTSPQRPSSSLPLIHTSSSSWTLDSDSPLDSSAHRSAGPPADTRPERGAAPPPAPPPGEDAPGLNPLLEVADRAVRRSWLSSCLLACLQPSA